MEKRKFLLISLQVVALTGFILMAVGSKSSAPAVQSDQTLRMNREKCGNPDFVFLGTFDDATSCSQACKKAGFVDFCNSGNNCYCK